MAETYRCDLCGAVVVADDESRDWWISPEGHVCRTCFAEDWAEVQAMARQFAAASVALAAREDERAG